MYRQANLRHYPTSLLRDAARSKEAPMDLDPKPTFRTGEPPRKRTHYESEEMEIDEYVPPVSAPRIIPTAANKAPFMFHAPSVFSSSSSNTTMHIDEPAPIPSTSADALQEKQQLQEAERDIANGAVQRERKRRNKLKDWQIVKSLPETDDDEEDNNDDTMNNDDSPGFTAAARSLLRRNRSKRGNQPVHFSLHHHNYHYPPSSDPFVFNGASSSSSASSLSLSSPSSSQQQTPSSTWWKEEGPYILLGYLQFTFNASLVCIALYLLSSFVLMLSNDISDRTSEYTVEIQQEIMHCSEAYMANRCNPAERVPAMDRQCREWEFCMNRNPKVVNKARVGAETLAEVVNSFFEVISWRTMLFLLAILTVIISLTNRTISDYRKSHTKFHEVHQARLQAQSLKAQRPGLTSANTAPGRIADVKL